MVKAASYVTENGQLNVYPLGILQCPWFSNDPWGFSNFCPLNCYCVLTIAHLLLLIFCTHLIVLCRTIGSVGISRVLCMPWSTSSFCLTGVPDITLLLC